MTTNSQLVKQYGFSLKRDSGRNGKYYSFRVSSIDDNCNQRIKNINTITDNVNDSIYSSDIGRTIEVDDSLVAFKVEDSFTLCSLINNIDDLHNSLIDSNTKRLFKNIEFTFISKHINSKPSKKDKSKYVRVEQEW